MLEYRLFRCFLGNWPRPADNLESLILRPTLHRVIFPYFLVFGKSAMLAKKTVKNQITLPKKIADLFPRVEYFDIRVEDDRIILEPLKSDRASQVRDKLASLKITEADIEKAVDWARKAKA